MIGRDKGDSLEWNLAHWDEIPERSKNRNLPRGVTQEMFWRAVKDNEPRVRKLLGPYSSWTGDVLCEFAAASLKAVHRWVGYENRRPLAAFLNKIAHNTVDEWLDRARPHHRGGMTQTPKRDTARLAPPPAGADADEIRAWLAEASRRDQSDRFNTGRDINADVNDDGAVILGPLNRIDYDKWFLDEADAGADAPEGADEWIRECKALHALVRHTYRGVDAWNPIISLASRDYRPDSASGLLRKELVTWLTAFRDTGRMPSLDRFPILTRVCRNAQKRARNRPAGRRRTPTDHDHANERRTS